MRIRVLTALALLLVPGLSAEAQRLPLSKPRIGAGGPARPAPLPPTANPIAREMVYVRLPFTAESYPLISYINAPGLGSSWTTGGAGTRLDLRLTRIVSLTLDMTTSFIGGPAVTSTVELGTRVRPQFEDARKWYPFVDLRAGYLNLSERLSRPYDYVDPTTATAFSQMSHGLGYVAGTGLEYALHPKWTITTTGSALRTRLSPVYSDRPVGPATLTAMRYSIGVRYNPGRWQMPANLPHAIAR